MIDEDWCPITYMFMLTQNVGSISGVEEQSNTVQVEEW